MYAYQYFFITKIFVLVCISFRLKCTRVYNIDTKTFTFKEDTSKSAGQMVAACPSVFPGFFVYDTHFLPFPDIFYSCSSYVTFPDNDRKKALMIPTLNAFVLFCCFLIYI